MRAIRELAWRVMGMLMPGRAEREMAEEQRFHIAMQTEENVRRGMGEEEAARRARIAYGNSARYSEEVRDARGIGLVEDMWRDARHAVRSLWNAPTFTAVAVVTLALGIGGNAAVFNVVNAVLLRPMSFPESERIVRIYEVQPDEDRWGTISSPNFYDWVERMELFESAALYDEYRPTLFGGGEPVQVGAASVGAGYFDVLGVTPAAGRFFLPEEEVAGADRVVLSGGLWQERFGGSQEVIGSTLLLSDVPYTVIGVAPQGMDEPALSGPSFEAPRLWRSPPDYFRTNSRGSRSFTAIARLLPDVSVERAQEELSAVHAALAEQYPAENANRFVRLVPLHESVVGEARTGLVLLLAAVGLVLLIACANIANLVLFRAAGRGREMAMRAALGASRRRLVQFLTVEAMVLAGLGAAVGVLVAALGARAFVLIGAGEIPRIEGVTTDARVLAFTAAAAVLAGLLFGLLPALHTTRFTVAGALRQGDRNATAGREQGRLRSVLVAVEVGLAVVVVTFGALLARSLLQLQAVDSGMSVERVVTLQIDPPDDPYFADDGDTLGLAVEALYARLVERVRAVPGVEAAGLTDILPLSGSFNGAPYRVAGEPEPAPGEGRGAEWRSVDAGFFAAMGIPLVEGEPIPRDPAAMPSGSILINRTLARRHWPDGGAAGARIVLNQREHTVRGVVGDVAQFTLAGSEEPAIYFPHRVAPSWMRDDQTLIVRTSLDLEAIAPSLRAAIREVEPRMPVSNLRSMESVVGQTLVAPRFRAVLLSSFALLALLLSALGVYALMANRVASRTREMGVRMALGASAHDLVRMVVVQGLGLVAAGIGVGVAGALAASRLLAGLLFGVAPTDPLTFALVPALLLGVAGLAAWLPARRAARVPVAQVLRES